MRYTLLSFLFLSLVLLAASKPPKKAPDSFSFLLGQITMPYTNIIKEFRTKAEKDLGNLKTYLHQQLSGEKAQTQKKGRAALNFEGDTKPEEDVPYVSLSASREGRVLAATCFNGGIPTTADVTIYSCNGAVVSADDYNSANPACSSSQSTVDACYCPFDHYGDQCENHNSFTCEIDRLNYPVQCSGTSGQDYVYSYSGIPPCYPVRNGETITMTNKLVCRNMDSSYDFEGVKPALYSVNTQPDVGSNPFTYAIDGGDNFKQMTMPSNVRQRMTFINWARMTNPYMLETPLTANQVAGVDSYNQDITFSGALSSYAFVGRYSYELTVLKDSSSNLTSGYFGGYFEQAGYVEPSASHKVSKALVIALPIVGVLLVLALLMGYTMYRRHKRQQLIEHVQVDPLLADQ